LEIACRERESREVIVRRSMLPIMYESCTCKGKERKKKGRKEKEKRKKKNAKKLRRRRKWKKTSESSTRRVRGNTPPL
jgi:hypothetical protein